MTCRNIQVTYHPCALQARDRRRGPYAYPEVTMLGVVTHQHLLQRLDELHAKVDILMTQQDDLNADVQTIEAGVANLGTAAAAIQAEIDALKQQNPALDLSGLDKAAADLSGAVSSVQALAPPSS